MDDNLRRMGLDKTRARKGAVRPKVTGEDVRRLLAEFATGGGVPFIDAASQAAQGNYGQAAISGLLDAPPVKMAGMALAPLIGMVRKSAPMDEALRIAQKNAAKPVSEGGLGLPPDNTPMDRAMAMGFEGDLYHGTNAENVIDEMRLGSGKLGDAAYVTNNPMNAKNYPILHNMARKNKGLEPLPPSIYPVMVRRGNTLNLDSLPVGQVDSKKISDAGYDSISHRHETAVIDPSRIRSRFAAFDPARINENNLLASLAALGISIPVMRGLLQEEEMQ